MNPQDLTAAVLSRAVCVEANFTGATVLEVDLAGRRVVIDPPRGLLPGKDDP